MRRCWLAALIALGLAGQAGAQTCNGLPATIVGDDGDNTLDGTDGPDVIFAGGGNDLVNGRGGDDVICGGDGNDSLIGGDGNDWLAGESGNDGLGGGGGNDTLLGGDGEDTLAGGDGDDDADGGNDRDSVRGDDGQDVVSGGGGNDELDGGAGDDRLDGGEGEDRLIGGDGNDRLNGGLAADFLDGSAGDDDLFGDAGDDVLVGGTGLDLCDGNAGVDSADSGCESRTQIDMEVYGLTLYAEDGTPLAGELYLPAGDAAGGQGTRRVAMVVSHGAMGSFAGGVPKSAGLWGAPRGWTVLALNRRDWGMDAGGGNTLFEDATRDLGVGVDFLERLGFERIFVAGHSQGTTNAGVYPGLTRDPRLVAAGLYGTVRDGSESARTVLFVAGLYEAHIELASELVAAGRGEELQSWLTTFGVPVFRSSRTFLSYWGPDTLSNVDREIRKAEVPVLLMRADGDEFTPDSWSVQVRDSALAAGVDAAYILLPYDREPGPTGAFAHSFIGVERELIAETHDWLRPRAPEVDEFVTGVPERQGSGNLVPVVEAGPDVLTSRDEQETLSLDGRNSLDLDGAIARIEWRQTGGPLVTLSDPAALQTAFRVPRAATRLTFELRVTDDQGATGTDDVEVQVSGQGLPGGSGAAGPGLVLALLGVAALGRRRPATRR